MTKVLWLKFVLVYLICTKYVGPYIIRMIQLSNQKFHVTFDLPHNETCF